MVNLAISEAGIRAATDGEEKRGGIQKAASERPVTTTTGLEAHSHDRRTSTSSSSEVFEELIFRINQNYWKSNLRNKISLSSPSLKVRPLIRCCCFSAPSLRLLLLLHAPLRRTKKTRTRYRGSQKGDSREATASAASFDSLQLGRVLCAIFKDQSTFTEPTET